MRQITFSLTAVAMALCIIAPRTGHAADETAAPVFVTKIPTGYRDWKFVSVAHEEGNLHSIGAVLGNDIAIQAYREGKLPFPDGAIVAALRDGKPVAAASMKSCFPCHAKAPATDLVFTHYAP